MLVRIDDDTAVKMLMDRLNEFWKPEPEVSDLYEKMYENCVYGGIFEGGEFDPMKIVDNDWVNYCSVKCEDDSEWAELLKAYKNGGCGDVSCEVDGISLIEAVDDDDNPTMMLVRY